MRYFQIIQCFGSNPKITEILLFVRSAALLNWPQNSLKLFFFTWLNSFKALLSFFPPEGVLSKKVHFSGGIGWIWWQVYSSSHDFLCQVILFGYADEERRCNKSKSALTTYGWHVSLYYRVGGTLKAPLYTFFIQKNSIQSCSSS